MVARPEVKGVVMERYVGHKPSNTGGKFYLTITPNILYVGTPVALVTTANPDGTTNISPMSSAWALADRMVLGLTGSAQGSINAVRERQLVINFPDPGLWPKVEALAPTTGADPVPLQKQAMGFRFEPDKFAVGGLTPQASQVVRPCRVAECPIQMEAEVVAVHAPGDWPEGSAVGFHIFETRVLRVHARADLVVPGTQHIDPARWSPLLYVFRHYFGCGPELGKTFRATV